MIFSIQYLPFCKQTAHFARLLTTKKHHNSKAKIKDRHVGAEEL